MAKTAIQIKEIDQVATATDDLYPGDEVIITGVTTGTTLQVQERIPVGHKTAITKIDAHTEIYKYGEVIGIATKEILPGQWVHVHNCWGIKARRFSDMNERGE
ncbi:UxaA family hydrolase [Brevibacillus sp. B_LB10_24]|uniref:UxaA family hydrolase n=1 Tax=Brevibacillus sp. B_LB10_24 TaxID=3380645 RepID=UPI0038BC2B57